MNQPGSAQAIIADAAARHSITVAAMLGGSQTKAVVLARRYAIVRIKHNLGLSLPHIGRLLGLHHTTVFHHLRKGAAELAELQRVVDPAAPDESGIWAI